MTFGLLLKPEKKALSSSKETLCHITTDQQPENAHNELQQLQQAFGLP